MLTLNSLDIWVEIHNLTSGFKTARVVKEIANYIGTFVEMDLNKISGFWRDYLRVRVKLRVDRPLKIKKKLESIGGDSCYAMFTYEDIPTFCFICGILGHSERFYERLLTHPEIKYISCLGFS